MPADLVLLLAVLVFLVGIIFVFRGPYLPQDDELSRQGQMPGEVGFGYTFTRFIYPLIGDVRKWFQHGRKPR